MPASTAAMSGKRHADEGYDYKRCRAACRRRGITPRIARVGVEAKDCHGGPCRGRR